MTENDEGHQPDPGNDRVSPPDLEDIDAPLEARLEATSTVKHPDFVALREFVGIGPLVSVG